MLQFRDANVGRWLLMVYFGYRIDLVDFVDGPLASRPPRDQPKEADGGFSPRVKNIVALSKQQPSPTFSNNGLFHSRNIFLKAEIAFIC